MLIYSKSALFLYVIIPIITLAYFFIKYKYSYWIRRGIPQEPPVLPYGNMKDSKTIHFSEILKKFYDNYKGQTPFFGIYFFLFPSVLALDLDLIKNILIKDFNYFTDRFMYCNEKDDPLSAHLFSLDGQKWKPLRNKLSPTFTSGKMKFMFQTIKNVGDQFAEVMSDEIEKEPELEIKDILARFTTDVIGSCAFGIECNSLKNPNTEFRVMGRKIFTNQLNPIKEFIITAFPEFAKKLGLRLNPVDLEKFFMRIVRQSIEYREKNNVMRNDFLHLLMQMKNDDKKTGSDEGFTLEEITAQAFIFFFAGFETSSTLMSFILYELANNQEIQDKLRKEINDVLAKYDGNFTYEAMKDMKYMDQVINEGLRKYPPLTALMRRPIKDYKIEEVNCIIEKGTLTLIPVLAIHYDPEFYPNPNVFDPERFTPENSINRHQVSFLPFGDGPRNCVGLRFGLMQTRVGLFSLIKNFKFEKCSRTPSSIKINPKIFVLTAESLIYLKVIKL